MYKDTKISALIVAAGTGSRFGGDVPKQFKKLGNRTVLEEVCILFEKSDIIDDIVVVCSEIYLDFAKVLLSDFKKLKAVVTGGAERQDSVKAGLDAVIKNGSDDIVLVHDAARPFASISLIENIAEAAYIHGAAIPVVRPKDTIRTREKTLDRQALYAVQTPQGFRLEILRDAYEKAFAEGFIGTDEASIAERAGYTVHLIDGEDSNKKITTPEDISLSEIRAGTGYDVHRLVPERECIICGVRVPHETGLLGHSDADVATHALMDAILGAAAMGDIGRHFPDSDKEYEGVSSIELLKKVKLLIADEGYSIGNVDITVICQKPKLAPYIEVMRDKLSEILDLEKDRINIKATTSEGLGFTGREEGIAANAVCTLVR